MVRIGVLTSSRADFGVYLPLIKAMNNSESFSIQIIAFGTHVSKFHGYTLTEIESAGFSDIDVVVSTLTSDTENAISTSSALTSLKFADYWELNSSRFDWVLCLGDRYEMFAAVVAGVPYGIKFAHFYGGDYSPGAIDNVYRNCLSNCSSLHFVSTKVCADRLERMLPDEQTIQVVGIMSLEETLNTHEGLSKEDFSKKWGVHFNRPTILTTIHPETIEPHKNENHAIVLLNSMRELILEFDFIVTMPNSDTNGIVYRKILQQVKNEFPNNIALIENFGLQDYFSCMKYSNILLGNTSSGISEAASFGKFVVNVGDRQKGRSYNENVFSVPFDKNKMVSTIKELISRGEYKGENIYFKPNSIQSIMETFQNEKLS